MGRSVSAARRPAPALALARRARAARGGAGPRARRRRLGRALRAGRRGGAGARRLGSPRAAQPHRRVVTVLTAGRGADVRVKPGARAVWHDPRAAWEGDTPSASPGPPRGRRLADSGPRQRPTPGDPRRGLLRPPQRRRSRPADHRRRPDAPARRRRARRRAAGRPAHRPGRPPRRAAPAGTRAPRRVGAVGLVRGGLAVLRDGERREDRDEHEAPDDGEPDAVAGRRVEPQRAHRVDDDADRVRLGDLLEARRASTRPARTPTR